MQKQLLRIFGSTAQSHTGFPNKTEQESTHGTEAHATAQMGVPPPIDVEH